MTAAWTTKSIVALNSDSFADYFYNRPGDNRRRWNDEEESRFRRNANGIISLSYRNVLTFFFVFAVQPLHTW